MNTSERVEVLRMAVDLAQAAHGSRMSTAHLRAAAREAGLTPEQDDLSFLVRHYFNHLSGLLAEAGGEQT